MKWLSLLSKFDPWRSSLCTCPPKLTFNPYSGCDHRCVYCYASSYIPRFFDCRPKKDLVPRLKREAKKLKGQVISMANSSDPYPLLEAKTGLTRQCLSVLSKYPCQIQVVTKSNIVARDVDLLSKIPSSVALTITTQDSAVAKKIEPFAPMPNERLKTVEKLTGHGISVSARIDPIIPFVNDNPKDLIKTLAGLGVKHVTSSTYKIKKDNWRRFSEAMPKIAEKLKPLYFERGVKVSGYTLLPKELRYKLLKNIRGLAKKNGMKFGVCREAFSQLNTGSCDGSWLLFDRTRGP